MDCLAYVVYRLDDKGKKEYYSDEGESLFTKDKHYAFLFTREKSAQRISREVDGTIVYGIGTDKELKEYIGEESNESNWPKGGSETN